MKILGGLLIILTSIVLSHAYDKRQKEQLTALKEIYDFVSFMKSQIEYFALPLDVIYKKFNKDSCYIDSFMQGKEIEIFDVSVRTELVKATLNLGKGYKHEQLKELDYLCFYLNKIIAECESNYKQKTKVFRAISLFTGSCVVILLL